MALQSGSVGDAWSQIVRLKILFRPTLEEKEYDQQQKKCEPHGHQGNQGQFTGHGRNSNSLLRLGIRRRSGQVRLCLIRRCHREILLIRSRCLSWKRVLILFLFGAKWIVMLRRRSDLVVQSPPSGRNPFWISASISLEIDVIRRHPTSATGTSSL